MYGHVSACTYIATNVPSAPFSNAMSTSHRRKCRAALKRQLSAPTPTSLSPPAGCMAHPAGQCCCCLLAMCIASMATNHRTAKTCIGKGRFPMIRQQQEDGRRPRRSVSILSARRLCGPSKGAAPRRRLSQNTMCRCAASEPASDAVRFIPNAEIRSCANSRSFQKQFSAVFPHKMASILARRRFSTTVRGGIRWHPTT